MGISSFPDKSSPERANLRVEEEDRFVAPALKSRNEAIFSANCKVSIRCSRRPIVNTRDEPHANPVFTDALHVILGDANMSPFSTRTENRSDGPCIGSVRPAIPNETILSLADPLQALMSISRDPKFRWKSWPLKTARVPMPWCYSANIGRP